MARQARNTPTKKPTTDRVASLKPVLEDPDNVREVFATEVAGIGLVAGNFHITLAAQQPVYSSEGDQPEVRRVVVSRLLLAPQAAHALFNMLAKMSEAAQTAAAKQQFSAEGPKQ